MIGSVRGASLHYVRAIYILQMLWAGFSVCQNPPEFPVTYHIYLYLYHHDIGGIFRSGA